MPTFNGNDIFLTYNGTDIAGGWQEVTLSQTNEDVDGTAGSGVDWSETLPGLNSCSVDLTVVYDTSTVDTIRALITPGRVATLIIGPEGNSSGKPKHEQDFKVGNPSFTQTATKQAVVFTVSMMSSGAPTANFFGSGEF